MERGKVYVASMVMRGPWAKPPPELTNYERINATSAQAKNNKNRRDFSPMTPIEDGYKGFWCFENYWQSGKVFEDVPQEVSRVWWQGLKEPKRRYPGAKIKKVLYAKFPHIDRPLSYVESRKEVYCPEYFELIKDTEMMHHWRQKVAEGTNLIVYDFDGPKGEKNEPLCLEVSKELLEQKINDERYPFGHSYIIAGYLMGLLPEDYTK